MMGKKVRECSKYLQAKAFGNFDFINLRYIQFRGSTKKKNIKKNNFFIFDFTIKNKKNQISLKLIKNLCILKVFNKKKKLNKL